MSDEQVVVLRPAGWTPLQAVGRGGSFPAADYGTRCACCDAETNLRMKFNPSTGYAASPIAVPTCKDCAPHLQKSVPIAAGMLALGSLLFFAMAWKNGIVWAVIGGLVLAAAGAIELVRRNHQAAMRRTGHHIGLQLIAIPGLVQLRTTNRRFADEVRAKNPDLAKPAE